MRIMPGPAHPLRGRFNAFLPFGRRQTWSLINTRGVWPNILPDSQSGQAWISFALHMWVFVCVYARLGKGQEPTKDQEDESTHRTESSRALCICWNHLFLAYIPCVALFTMEAALVCAGSCWLYCCHTLQRLSKSPPDVLCLCRCTCNFYLSTKHHSRGLKRL